MLKYTFGITIGNKNAINWLDTNNLKSNIDAVDNGS